MFVYQPIFNKLQLKEDKCTNVTGWKSKAVYTVKPTPLSTAFLHDINVSGYRIGIQFDTSVLVVEQNNQATKLVNAYIVYDLDTWPKIPLNNLN